MESHRGVDDGQHAGSPVGHIELLAGRSMVREVAAAYDSGADTSAVASASRERINVIA